MIIPVAFTVLSICIIGSAGSALHGPCETDDDCGTMDTVCKNGVCACQEQFAVWFDSCISLAQPRVACTKKHECHKKMGIRSICTKKNQCACKAFHHLHLGQCVKNRDLHDTCDHDHQCYCGADCQSKIACIHKNCSCIAGHSPYKSRRCISDLPMVLSVADQQIQVTQLPEKLPQSSTKEEVVAMESSPVSRARAVSSVFLLVLFGALLGFEL
ncbi:uncharacterized protein LOC109535015 [Dendroctonus ponderosae]